MARGSIHEEDLAIPEFQNTLTDRTVRRNWQIGKSIIIIEDFNIPLSVIEIANRKSAGT